MIHNNAEMNSAAREVAARLARQFAVTPAYDGLLWQGECPIGIEIEVKWRHYFPELWQAYFVDRKFEELSGTERAALDLACAEQESWLLPRLQATVECGVRRGADRYWEFALAPSADIFNSLEQLHVLRAAGLIPNGEHSLHLTIGGLSATPDAYYLLMLLELLFGSAARIQSGFHTKNPKMSGGWARKGRAGIFIKEGADLQYGYDRAVELRVLSMADSTDTEQLLKIVSTVSDILLAHQHGRPHPKQSTWHALRGELKQALRDAGLPDENWNKPNLNPDVWQAFIGRFGALQAAAAGAFAPYAQDLAPATQVLKMAA